MSINISSARYLLLLMIACHVFSKAVGQNFFGLPIVRNFSSVEYNAGIQNYQIALDKQGILYVANNFGLLEYDGEHWKIYGVKNGTKVRSIAIDGRGKIYTGSQGDFGYFFPDKRGILTYNSLADSLSDKYRNLDETWNVFIDKGTVYFCTPSYVFVYQNKSFNIIELAHAETSFFINRQLFVNRRGIGLGVLENNSIIPLLGGSYFSDLSITSMFLINSDEYLISTVRDGIFVLSNGAVKPWNENYQPLYKEANINCMIRLHNGQFAIGTQNKGLIKSDEKGNVLLELTRGQGLENRTVLSLKEDDGNNLWVGQNNEIAYVEMNSPFKLINEKTGLEGTGYAAYLDNNQMYFGTNTGLYVNDTNTKAYFKKISRAQSQVYKIKKHNPDLLISQHAGAFRLDNNTAIPISSEKGSWAFLAFKNDPAKLIEGTYNGLNLYTLNEGHWKFLKKLKGFTESSRIMAEDDLGNLWVTHGYKGAYKIKLNNKKDSIISIAYYDYKKGFPSTQLINVFRIRNELVFTSERGVFKYDPANDKFILDDILTQKLGPSVQLWFVQEDALGNIYFIGKEQIGVLRLNSTNEYMLETSQFNKLRKYLNDDLQNITILKNNVVLFGAKDGFILFDPRITGIIKSNFFALIRRVEIARNRDSLIFNGKFWKGDSIQMNQMKDFIPTLPYQDNSIKIGFSATSYEGSNDLLYQYYLAGYEKNWSVWGNQTKLEYANLPEGNYTFHLRAKNVNGDISAESFYTFIIRPPWYRSYWAYACYSLALVAGSTLTIQFIKKKYDDQRRRMTLIQETKLNKKNEEIEKLAITNQQEIVRLQNEKLESEINHMNNELATATMHLLNKNEFISSIKTQLSQLAKKNKVEEVNLALQQISKEIENNISGDSDWEHFQFHFDRVHGDFISRLKLNFTELSPQETKLCAYLRLNLSSKEIAQLLNISVRGVEISRYRLRKKLQLDRNQNLQEFILNF
jgi:DNA-binding CsgD family transcriptional regulator